MAKITINGISINPETSGQQLEAFGLASVDASTSNYVLIQTDGPINRNQRRELVDCGVELLEYVPENSYIGGFEQDDLSRIRALPFVTWVNIYLHGFKISGDLMEGAVGEGVAAFAAAGAPLADDSRQVDIVLHRGVAGDQVLTQIAEAAGLDPATLAGGRNKVRARLQRSRLQRVAQIDQVRHIEEVFEPGFSNDVAGNILRSDRVHNAHPSYRGEGEVVAVCDSGFDRGSTTDVHPAFSGRVLQLYDLGRAGRANDPHGHGTHVAGSVLADGSVEGHGDLTGTAPAAQLVLQSVLDSFGGLGGLPTDLNDLFDGPYAQDGARVHTNSWGTTHSSGRYTMYSEEVDEFIWAHRDLVVCFAAGNPGQDSNGNGIIDGGSVEAPGTAKNCITVGASENDRPDQSRIWGVGSWSFRYPVSPIHDDLWADDPNGMAAFSGRGPTRDGRIKPDVVAPGTSILSACSRDATSSDFWGTSPDSLYCYMGGTSMATPLVAGCVAVVREFLHKERNMERPSAALIKAMLINGAVDLLGQYVPTEAADVPNFAEGFGRVDLERTLSMDAPDHLHLYDEDRELDTGDAVQLSFEVPEGVSRLKVTLVWTDEPGDGLKNDLDLIVRTDVETRHGNMAPGATGFDRINNVEQVSWDGVQGQVEVIVQAHRIAMHTQSYALVVRME